MHTENELPLRDNGSNDQDHTGLLNYVIYLKRYKYELENFLHKEMAEFYIELTGKNFVVPLSINEKLAIEHEIQQINIRIYEYEKFIAARS